MKDDDSKEKKALNNMGKGSGGMLVIILMVTILIAYLSLTQLANMGFGKQKSHQEEIQQDSVQKAQDAVDAVNERMLLEEP